MKNKLLISVIVLLLLCISVTFISCDKSQDQEQEQEEETVLPSYYQYKYAYIKLEEKQIVAWIKSYEIKGNMIEIITEDGYSYLTSIDNVILSNSKLYFIIK